MKRVLTNILMVIGTILIIAAILGILFTIVIVAYEIHWVVGSILGCFVLLAVGLFLINVLDENSEI